MTKVALLGAGGKMGVRLATNLQGSPYEVLHVEVSEEGRKRLRDATGFDCVERDAALRDADVVLMAVPDALIGKIAKTFIADVKPGCAIIMLDAAAPHAGELPERADVTYFVTHPCHPPIFNDETDMQAKKDLSEASVATLRKQLLKQIPLSDRIVFAPANPKYTLSVFTDVECGYCQKMHSEIAEYNRQGIEIQYLAFPRMGLGTPDHKKMIAVWCAADRKQALTAAKSGKGVPMKDCKNPVSMEYDIGQRAGLTGTPMIITADGEQVPGYMPPKELRAYLDGLSQPAAKTAANG